MLLKLMGRDYGKTRRETTEKGDGQKTFDLILRE
jgi:hypothetical protein